MASLTFSLLMLICAVSTSSGLEGCKNDVPPPRVVEASVSRDPGGTEAVARVIFTSDVPLKLAWMDIRESRLLDDGATETNTGNLYIFSLRVDLEDSEDVAMVSYSTDTIIVADYPCNKVVYRITLSTLVTMLRFDIPFPEFLELPRKSYFMNDGTTWARSPKIVTIFPSEGDGDSGEFTLKCWTDFKLWNERLQTYLRNDFSYMYNVTKLGDNHYATGHCEFPVFGYPTDFLFAMDVRTKVANARRTRWVFLKMTVYFTVELIGEK